MGRRRGRTIGTLLLAAGAALLLAYALFGDRLGWRTMPTPVVKAQASRE
jgi:hypothetical protein